MNDAPLTKPALYATLLRRAGGPLLSLLLLCLALWALHAMATEVTYRQIGAYVHGLPNTDIALAILLTGAGFAVMTLYDWFGLASIGRRLPARRVGLISFISYAFSNALGMSLLVSGSIRYRFYVQAGLSTGEVARVVLYTTLSFWLGLAALTGVTLLIVPIPPDVPLSGLRIPLAILLTLVPLAWFAAAALVRRPIRVGRWAFSTPTPQVAAR